MSVCIFLLRFVYLKGLLTCSEMDKTVTFNKKKTITKLAVCSLVTLPLSLRCAH